VRDRPKSPDNKHQDHILRAIRIAEEMNGFYKPIKDQGGLKPALARVGQVRGPIQSHIQTSILTKRMVTPIGAKHEFARA